MFADNVHNQLGAGATTSLFGNNGATNQQSKYDQEMHDEGLYD